MSDREETITHADAELRRGIRNTRSVEERLTALETIFTSPKRQVITKAVVETPPVTTTDIHLSGDEKSHFDFFNSTIAEQFDFTIASNGTVITGSLERTGGGDLTMRFADVEYIILDCTPAKTVIITEGTDTVPVHRHYYILQSSPTIITEGSDWPTAEHIKIDKVNVPSALFVQTRNVYSNQNINNMNAFVAGDLSGMLEHISHKIRESIGATYPQEGGGLGGGAGAGEYLDVSGGTTVRFIMDIGKVMQMHEHIFNAVNTGTGDIVLVRNFSGTPWKAISNIFDIINDSLGVSLTNRYYNLEVVAIASKETDYVMINVPAGSYANLANALEDKNRFDDKTIPLEFKGVATPICRLTLRKTAAGIVIHQTDDQRGINVAAFTGATVSGGYSDIDAIAAYQSDLLDEDDMATDSATQGATQQSIKAYVDTQDQRDILIPVTEFFFDDTSGSAAITSDLFGRPIALLTTVGEIYRHARMTFYIPPEWQVSSTQFIIDLIFSRAATDANFDIVYWLSSDTPTTSTTNVPSFDIASSAAFQSAQTTGVTASSLFIISKTVSHANIAGNKTYGLTLRFNSLTSDALNIVGVRVRCEA